MSTLESQAAAKVASGIFDRMATKFLPAKDESASPPSRFKMSARNRMLGFTIAVGVGVLFLVIAIGLIFGSHFKGFGTFYTFATVSFLIATCFLSGPITQFKQMLSPERVVASLTMVVFIVLTLVMAFAVKNAILVLIFAILQILATIYYILTLFPYSRSVIQGWFSRLKR
ncbi:hypothetical protein ACOME3_003640 [Neoechinorhynchus agilis]